MNILDATKEDLKRYLKERGEAPFHADQIFTWLARGAESFEEMTDLSKSLRERLQSDYEIFVPRIVEKQQSKRDKTVKYLFSLSDGNTIETVVMAYRHGYSICISSQVGCRMGCAFCASTLNGLVRGLLPHEMAGQMLAASRDLGARMDTVVVMGIGEPLDNYDNLMIYLKIINDKSFLNLGYRGITVSTCGLADKIDKLAKEKLPINLAVSLHAPSDALRREIMPVARAYPLEELLRACDSYFAQTGRRITFEYALIEGKNNSDAHALALARLLRGRNCHVNLIPLNEVRERSFFRGNRESAERFLTLLLKHHITATLRREMGSDIDAACGQLRNSLN